MRCMGIGPPALLFPLVTTITGLPAKGSRPSSSHREDFIGGIDLMVEAARRVNDRENTTFRQRLSQVAPEMRQRLQDTARVNATILRA